MAPVKPSAAQNVGGRATYFTGDPDLVPHLWRGLSPDLAPALAPAMLPCRPAHSPGLTLATAVRAGRPLDGAAVAAAADPGLSALLVAEGSGLGLTSAPLRLPFVAAARGGSAGSAVAGWNAARPAAPGISPEVHPAAPAEPARAHFAVSAPDTADALRRHAAGNGNSGCEAVAAAAPGDTDPLNTAAGKQEVVRALAQNCGSTCPIRFAAAPIHGPSALPSVAGHPAASRKSRPEGSGSSAPGRAG